MTKWIIIAAVILFAVSKMTAQSAGANPSPTAYNGVTPPAIPDPTKQFGLTPGSGGVKPIKIGNCLTGPC